MRASLKLFEHLISLLQSRRFPEEPGPDINQRVRAEHERVGKMLCHHARLPVGIDLSHFARRQLIGMRFGSLARHDAEFHAELAQQFGAAGRGGRQNERRQMHRPNLRSNAPRLQGGPASRILAACKL